MIKLDKYHSDIDGIYWVTQALSSEGSRYSLTLLKIENGFAIATDGHRLHSYELIDTIPEGLYEIPVRKKSEIMLAEVEGQEWPNFRSAVNFVDYSHWISVMEDSRGIEGKAYSKIVRAMPDYDLSYNYHYINQVLSDGGWWQVMFFNGRSAVEFLSDGKYAVVMPFSMVR